MTVVGPYQCKSCGHAGRVVESRPETGYRRRRHECTHGCKDQDGKPRRWTTYQSRISPRAVIRRFIREATT